jgi:hypothetical protein
MLAATVPLLIQQQAVAAVREVREPTGLATQEALVAPVLLIRLRGHPSLTAAAAVVVVILLLDQVVLVAAVLAQ